jgi:MFS family permease
VEGRFAPLSEPGFRWLLASRVGSGAALTGLRAAVAWHLFDLTGSFALLGSLGIAQFAPALGLSLVGGAFADAHDRRRIAIGAQLAELACVAALVLASAAGVVSVALLFGLVVTAAIAASFENPARASLLPLIVSREQFPAAVTIHSVAQALAFMSGPALAGLAIAAGGPRLAYTLSALLLAGSAAGLTRLAPRPAIGERRNVSWQAIREGLDFVRSQPVVLGCMVLDLFAVIFGGATALLPAYQRILGVGPEGYGLLSSALEAGAFAMSLLLVLRPPIERPGRALLIAVACFGFATIAFGLSRSFPLSLAAYAAVGMADQISVVMRSTMIQLATPDSLRGRVSSINLLFIGASNQLGAAESGFVAHFTSATFSVVSGGLACLFVVALVAWRIPELRSYRSGAPAT